MGKKKIAIIFGGKSTEHEISRMSAAYVLKNIDETKYDIYNIGITKKGIWFEYSGDINKIENGEWEFDEYYKLPNGERLLFNKEVDVVFPLLHGLYGEDGTIQGLCKLVNIPCVGCGVMSSAICMDKVYTKELIKNFKIKQAEYEVVKKYNYKQNKENIIKKIENSIGYDAFIKPSNSGSSIGITKAHNRRELVEGINNAFTYDRKVLIEKYIPGREIEVGILGNDIYEVTLPGEVIFQREFYDYKTKFNKQYCKFLIPAKLSYDKLKEIKKVAVNVYEILDCSGMAKIDFLVDKYTEDIYLNEVNTIPDFTKTSMYLKMWKVSGKSCCMLTDKLIELALERNNQ